MRDEYKAPEMMELGKADELTLGKNQGEELDFLNGFFPSLKL